MSRYEVASTAEVTETRAKLVTAGGVELAILRVGGGEYRAYRNLCPHAGAPLFTGWTTGAMVRCPWHGWEFDLATGAHLFNPACRLTAYAVEVEGDRLFVLA